MKWEKMNGAKNFILKARRFHDKSQDFRDLKEILHLQLKYDDFISAKETVRLLPGVLFLH